jgi:peptide/nickel transport system permease protein
MTAGTFDPVAIGEERGERPWRRTMRRLAKRRAALVGLTVVAFFIALSILAPLVSPYDPLATNWAMVRKPPSMLHLFGPTRRTILARVIWGGRGLADGRHHIRLAGAGDRRADRSVDGYVGGIVDATVNADRCDAVIPSDPGDRACCLLGPT